MSTVNTESGALTEAIRDAIAMEAHELGKSFGRLAVVQDVNLAVRKGELFGLIGPSGCGKTTLVRLLAGLAKPDSGHVRLLGKDPLHRTAAERAQAGYMPQGFFLFPNLTVLQNAGFVAGLYGIGWLERRKRIRELLEHFELWDARSRRVDQLSGGMQRRLTLACAIIHGPEAVFVDEPTVGLDPILRAKIWDYLHKLRDAGTAIILTTQHVVEEAALCDRIGLMLSGRIIVTGTPEELRREAFQGDPVEIAGEGFDAQDIANLRGVAGMRHVERSERGLRVFVDNFATAAPTITQILTGRGKVVHATEPHVSTFDEVFSELIARHGADHG